MIKRNPNACFFTACFFLTTALLSGCVATKHSGNAWIVDVLTNDVNVEAMMLFTDLSDGAWKSRFANYRGQYHRLIGALDALEMQVRVRQQEADELAGTDKDASNRSESPLELIRGMLRTIREMRDIHATVGLTAGEVEGLRRDWSLYMYQKLLHLDRIDS